MYDEIFEQVKELVKTLDIADQFCPFGRPTSTENRSCRQGGTYHLEFTTAEAATKAFGAIEECFPHAYLFNACGCHSVIIPG